MYPGRAISNSTYEMFRKKYKIKKYVKVEKSLDEIRKEIYEFEKAHRNEIGQGLYFNVPKNK
jgi:hypothetical protein